MFTGIVEELGRVLSVTPLQIGAHVVIGCRNVLADASTGASIAVNGTCLTALNLTPDSFAADLSPETLMRTSLGQLEAGSLVNLERPLRFNGRLDGHFVLGHVDGTAEVVSTTELGNGNWTLRIRVPHELARYIVSKASVAVDGISLTVARIEGDEAEFAIIPHTWEHTNLQEKRPGSLVNLEVDILAKHLEKLVRASRST